MNAREMFEKMGYKRGVDIDLILYSKRFEGTNYYFGIIFDLIEKIICIDTNFEGTEIDDVLLKAIDKQAEELGWLDEKTCTNESEYNLVDGFECSNCGIIIENYNEIEIDEDDSEDRCMKEYAPRYCPNCGRKIVEEKEND